MKPKKNQSAVAVRILLTVLMVIGLLSSALTLARSEEPKNSEYWVKAAFIYNIFKFVDEKNDPSSADYQFCILGEAPFLSEFNSIKDKPIDGKKIVIKQIEDPRNANCRAIFITSSEQRQISQITRQLKPLGILTLSDTTGFGQKGVMINFYLDQNKVRFEINLGAAEEAGVKISSKLLNLSTIVRSEP